jgi:penicillin amidase
MTAPTRSPVRFLLALALVFLGRPPHAGADDPPFAKKTHTFKTAGKLPIQADVYRHDDRVVRPVVVWIHGGALIMGSRTGVPRDLFDLCKAEGFALVSLDYRLAPEVKLPAIIEDVEDAFRWLRTQGPKLLHIDPDRLVVAGGSAGGYLTLMTGFRIKPRPRALVAYWGYGDVDGDWYTKPSAHYRKSPLVSKKDALDAVGGAVLANTDGSRKPRGRFYLYLRQNGLWTKEVTGFDPAKQRKKLDPYCPVRNVTRDYPPTMLVHGTEDTDVPYELSAAMAKELARHKVAHELVTVRGAGHGLFGGDRKAVALAQKKAIDFIRRQLKAEEALEKNAMAVLAPLDGAIRLKGLKAPVEVLRDRWGIPHIYAKSADDLFFAQGFVAAQDRLFQLDWWRRQGAGELAEVVGARAVEADRFARLIRYRGDADAEWQSYSPDARRIAAAFTAGINACIDHMGDKLPIEFQILGHAPKKWRPEDVLGRMSGIVMSGNFAREVARARLVAAVGVEKARWLAPVDPPIAYAPAPGLDLAGVDERILAGFRAATRLSPIQPAKSESNNWVVSGSRSASGKPLLASDPHRTIALPSLRYLVHLSAPGWNVIGSGEPGLPGVAIGHNERIAWGFTIVGTDQADLYVETTDPKDPTRYRAGGRWEAMKVIREEVAVKGEAKPRTLELRFTRHGPVLFQDAKTNRAFALKWAGSEPGGAAYLASLAVDRARNKDEFLQALARWKIPGLNFVYADVDGNIGWVAAALTPVRKNQDGLLPVPGEGGHEWLRYLSVAELPQQFNPRTGFLATANHNILPPGYEHTIGHEFAAPYRYQRVRSTLESKKLWKVEEMQAIQHDSVSLPGRALGRLLAQVEIGEDLKPFARRLAGWDGHLSVDSPAGPLYAAWLKELKAAMFALHVPKGLHQSLGQLCGVPVLLAALEKADPRWFGQDARAARDRLLRETFARAVKRIRDLPPRWGAVHTATFRHPLAGLSPAHARVFNLGPLERPGDEFTPNNTRHDDNFRQLHGATYRHLLDLADWDRGLATSAPGQSGQPGSPHYGDLAPLWGKGEYFPLAFSRKKVEAVTRHRLRLLPEARP